MMVVVWTFARAIENSMQFLSTRQRSAPKSRHWYGFCHCFLVSFLFSLASFVSSLSGSFLLPCHHHYHCCVSQPNFAVFSSCLVNRALCSTIAITAFWLETHDNCRLRYISLRCLWPVNCMSAACSSECKTAVTL